MKKPSRLLLVSIAALFLSGCGSVKIGKILSDPNRYRNKTVSVEGNVDNSFGALVAGFYQVHDDTGKIYVISSRGGVPSRGARVRVKGKVIEGITIAGRSFGTAIRESDHKTR
jgi:hypothetical protein